ncbi:hypothetical protein CK500_15115 [Halorubrum salipaludis]|uniref:Uncharacterized protein n=1 Tax=Halorubrum salipaludis TaxID=2032630 RepID=A0A2A2F8H1_9EURY|nr:hypothetical protein CK500_15115 [Halorubrum salipaludis]
MRGGSVDTHKPMYTGSTRGIEILVQDTESTLTDEYPPALAKLGLARHVSHDLSSHQNGAHQPDKSLAINTLESTMTTPHPPKAASPRNLPSMLPTNGTSQ